MNGDKKYFDELVKNNTLEIITKDLDEINIQVMKYLKNKVAYHKIWYDLNDYLVDQYYTQLNDEYKNNMKDNILKVY